MVAKTFPGEESMSKTQPPTQIIKPEQDSKNEQGTTLAPNPEEKSTEAEVEVIVITAKEVIDDLIDLFVVPVERRYQYGLKMNGPHEAEVFSYNRNNIVARFFFRSERRYDHYVIYRGGFRDSVALNGGEMLRGFIAIHGSR